MPPCQGRSARGTAAAAPPEAVGTLQGPDALRGDGGIVGPTKFVRVVHSWTGTAAEHSTEILCAGGGLLLAGDAETQLAPIIQTLDTALLTSTWRAR